MLNVRNIANALATTFAILYVGCAVLVAVLPGAYMWTVDSWAHGMNLASLFDPTKVLNIGSGVAGLVTFTIFGWLSGAVFATVYNRLQTGASGK